MVSCFSIELKLDDYHFAIKQPLIDQINKCKVHQRYMITLNAMKFLQ